MSLLANLRKKQAERLAPAIPAIPATDGEQAGANREQDAGALASLPSGAMEAPALPTCEAFEERAAIMEYDAGLSRAEAEQAAALDVGCFTCAHFARPGLSDGYCGGRDDLPRAYGDNHPLRQLPGDQGATCKEWKASGAEARLSRPEAEALAWAEDDRRKCRVCRNLQAGVCSIAAPGALVSARRGYSPLPDTLLRCAGYDPKEADPDQRKGIERWPNLT